MIVYSDTVSGLQLTLFSNSQWRHCKRQRPKWGLCIQRIVLSTFGAAVLVHVQLVRPPSLTLCRNSGNRDGPNLSRWRLLNFCYGKKDRLIQYSFTHPALSLSFFPPAAASCPLALGSSLQLQLLSSPLLQHTAESDYKATSYKVAKYKPLL